MKPILFISHSTLDKALALEVKQAFDQDFDTFLDSEAIEAGDNWRRAIESALLDCHAAVVLLSENAIASEWVQFETGVLALLANHMPANRVFIPLRVDGIDPKRLTDPRLAPAGLDPSQAPAIDSQNPDLTPIQPPLRRLVREFAKRSQLADVETYVAGLMNDLNRDKKVAVAKALNIAQKDIERAYNPGRWLAGTLLALHDPEKYKAFLRSFTDAGGPELTLDLLAYVFPHCWTDPEVVQELAGYLLRGDDPRTAVGMIAAKPDTPEHYLRCAAAQPPGSLWPVIPGNTDFSHQDGPADLAQRVIDDA